MFAVLGALLGRLHTRPAATARAGGAWHHLAAQGAPRQEIAAAAALLEELCPQVSGDDEALYDRLRGEVERADDCSDLPQAFVHPDLVPSNAVATPDGGMVIVDWAGAGRGPRVWSLGPLLLSAGAIGDLKLVDVVLSRYCTHTRLEPGELERLAAAMRARPLMIDCWSLAAGRKTLREVVGALAATAARAESMAERARQISEAQSEVAS